MLKHREKNNNPTGKGGFADNPQNRNTSGQRNKKAVRTATEARNLYLKLLDLPHESQPNKERSNLEQIVWAHVISARNGNSDAREHLFDRIWGKAVQTVIQDISINELEEGVRSQLDTIYGGS